ncbi:MAG: hypothetical protein AAF995_00445 [Planctomycetota bacterium]
MNPEPDRTTADWSIRPSNAPGLTHELTDQGGTLVAVASGANLLDDAFDAKQASGVGPADLPLVVRTGWLGERHGIGSGEHVWTAHPAQWLSGAREQFDVAVDALLEALGDRPLWLWPHARHVLSDGPSTRRWLEARAEVRPGARGLGVLLEPTALLTEAMIAEREEHLDRVVQTAEVSPPVREAIRGVVARGVRAFEGEEAGLIELGACAQSDGLVEPERVNATARRIADLAGVPIVRPLQ